MTTLAVQAETFCLRMEPSYGCAVVTKICCSSQIGKLTKYALVIAGNL